MSEDDKIELSEKIPSKIPEWLTVELFTDILKEVEPEYKETKNYNVKSAVGAGENYATVIIRIEIEVLLNDDTIKKVPFIMKSPIDNEMVVQMSKFHNIFDVELNMYEEIIPEMEAMYHNAGINICFGAKHYKLPIDKDHILLEDLSVRGFKNAKRQDGFDIDHTKSVLKKLAMWHAASATRHISKKFSTMYTVGFFNDFCIQMMQQMKDSFTKPFLKCARKYEGNELFYDKIEELADKMYDKLFDFAKVDENDFNVLNHGDCWANNFMFRYNDDGKLAETYFVDYQLPKFGPPIQDLYYMLLSSTSFDVKLSQFDYFIKYYHDNLIENLKLLGYKKRMPTLKDLHQTLLKRGLMGFQVATGVMPIVLLDPTDTANFDNFLGNTEECVDFKNLLYSNKRYRKHMEAVLPWLLNRGALEI